MASATLKSIARATGFSVTTISRALGGFDDVNEHTRRLILEEAQRQGYEPNLHARLLQGQRSQAICLVMPIEEQRFFDPFFTEFAAGVGHEAASVNFDLLLSTHAADPYDIAPYRRLVAGRRVDGFVVARTFNDDPRIHYLAETGIPFTVFGRTNSVNDFVYIDVEGDSGQAALTEHFIGLGHRRIAYITPPAAMMFTQLRLKGFFEAMALHNLPVDEALILEGDLTERGGFAAAQTLLDLPDAPPTAIMCGNDLMAFGVMRAVQERGLSVGGDVAVSGFDDIPLAEHIHPGLTTLRQPIYDIGRQLTNLLLRMIAGEEIADRATMLKPDLIVRASSGPSER